MKCTKILLTAAASVAISLGLMPTFPAKADKGEITCGNIIRNNGFRVIAYQGANPIYRGGQRVSYRYLYRVQTSKGRVVDLACLWSINGNYARLVRL